MGNVITTRNSCLIARRCLKDIFPWSALKRDIRDVQEGVLHQERFGAGARGLG